MVTTDRYWPEVSDLWADFCLFMLSGPAGGETDGWDLPLCFAGVDSSGFVGIELQAKGGPYGGNLWHLHSGIELNGFQASDFQKQPLKWRQTPMYGATRNGALGPAYTNAATYMAEMVRIRFELLGAMLPLSTLIDPVAASVTTPPLNDLVLEMELLGNWLRPHWEPVTFTTIGSNNVDFLDMSEPSFVPVQTYFDGCWAAKWFRFSTGNECTVEDIGMNGAAWPMITGSTATIASAVAVTDPALAVAIQELADATQTMTTRDVLLSVDRGKAVVLVEGNTLLGTP